MATDKYGNRKRTRQTFTLTGQEHRGARQGNERLVCYVKDDKGLLVILCTAKENMANIFLIERSGFPVTIECDWVEPDEYEQEHFRHRYWVRETDHLVIARNRTC